MVESVFLNYQGLILHCDFYLLNSISSDTVKIFLVLEETLVEGLESMVELNDNLIELKRVLYQV